MNSQDAERDPVAGEFAALAACQDHGQEYERGNHDTYFNEGEGTKLRARNAHKQE